MKPDLVVRKFWRGAFVARAFAAAVMALAPGAQAQSMGGSPKSPAQQQQSPVPQPGTPAPQNQQPQQPPEPAKDPEEEKAYKAFYDTNVQEPDKVIESGEAFAQKYPNSRYVEQVYSRLAQAYYNKQTLPKMYEYGDKALALNADDVTVLTLIGWVIPHDANSPDFDARLKRAEGYEKHALEKLSAMEKPAAMTDDQFAKAKAELTAQAHSGLGLVYFRENKPAESASELKLAVQGAASPDPTDYYVMGMELEKLNREGEAADAFQKCAQTPNSLQSRCKQNSEDARKKAASQPAK